MNDAALTLSQVRYVNKTFWRNPASAFFIFAFPLMFLVIFTALLGHGTVRVSPLKVVNTSTYYVAAMASFGVISACYTNIAISVSFQRDTGVLKRTNGTPLPSSVFLGARMLHALLVAVLLVMITAGFGRAAYSASIPTGLTLLRFAVMLLVGAAAFCALGFAITSVIPNADASPAIVNARRSCRCCSCPGSSSRWPATRRPGSCGSLGSSRSGTSPRACKPASSAPRSAGPTC
jgi:ABC-2 type transport system permease protein